MKLSINDLKDTATPLNLREFLTTLRRGEVIVGVDSRETPSLAYRVEGDTLQCSALQHMQSGWIDTPIPLQYDYYFKYEDIKSCIQRKITMEKENDEKIDQLLRKFKQTLKEELAE